MAPMMLFENVMLSAASVGNEQYESYRAAKIDPTPSIRLFLKTLFFATAHGFDPFWLVANVVLIGHPTPDRASTGPVRVFPSKSTLLPVFISQNDLHCPEFEAHSVRLWNRLRVIVRLEGLTPFHAASPGTSGGLVGVGVGPVIQVNEMLVPLIDVTVAEA